MPIFCVLPSSITLPSFRCLSITVSEIREFNRKKKKKEKKKMMNNGKSGFFQFDTFSTVQMDQCFDQTYFLIV